jgi:acylphosphatase
MAAEQETAERRTVQHAAAATRAAHVVVRGRVQGVAFRAATEAKARTLGVAGWVRNLPDGRVEAWIEAPTAALESMLAFCREGPPHARVDEVAIEAAAPAGFDRFEVR